MTMDGHTNGHAPRLDGRRVVITGGVACPLRSGSP
jgi:hypothetical protein